MAKVMTAKVKLQCPGGQATPAPPVGPALGQHGVNIGQFVMQFNERTKEMKGTTIPVEITIYSDRSFEFITKSPPAAVLLKQAAGIASGSAEPHKTKVGTVTADQVQQDRRDQVRRPQRPRPRPRLPDHRRHGPEHGRGGQGMKSRSLGCRSRTETTDLDDRDDQNLSAHDSARLPDSRTRLARRDRPPAGPRVDRSGGSPPSEEERATCHSIRSAIARLRDKVEGRRPGPAGRGRSRC